MGCPQIQESTQEELIIYLSEIKKNTVLKSPLKLYYVFPTRFLSELAPKLVHYSKQSFCKLEQRKIE